MKRKKLSALLAIILTLTIVAAMTAPLASASEVTIEFLNPLGKIDPLDNNPLAERTPWLLDANGKLLEKKVIGVYTQSGTAGTNAIAMALVDEFGLYNPETGHGIILVNGAHGGNWGRRADATYDYRMVRPSGQSLNDPAGQAVTYLTTLPATPNMPNGYGIGMTGAYSGWIDVVLSGEAN